MEREQQAKKKMIIDTIIIIAVTVLVIWILKKGIIDGGFPIARYEGRKKK